jgi:hypothetical protein
MPPRPHPAGRAAPGTPRRAEGTRRDETSARRAGAPLRRAGFVSGRVLLELDQIVQQRRCAAAGAGIRAPGVRGGTRSFPPGGEA